MEGIINTLANIEKLIYKILVWVVLVPKTLLQIVLHPEDVPEYIHKELSAGNSRFDEYMSPMILLLLVALVPSLLVGFRPTFGVDLTSPVTDKPSSLRSVDFDAKASFRSSSTAGHYVFIWTLYEEQPTDTSYNYPVVASVRHTNDLNNDREYTFFNQVDAHTVEDTFSFTFDEKLPGDRYYDVYVDAYKLDASGNTIETYYDDLTVYVPTDFNEDVVVSSYSKEQKPQEKKELSKDFVNQFKSDSTYLLALALLFPPLLFALIIKIFSREILSEDSLKETFYVQCYYFSPLNAAIWATYYGIYFITPDVILHSGTGSVVVLLPALLAVVWFITVETHAVSKPPQLSNEEQPQDANRRQMRGWQAFLIVVTCSVIVAIAGLLVIFAPGNADIQDNVRKVAIWLYLLVGFGLLLSFGWTWIRRLRAAGTRPTKGHWATLIGFLLVIGCIASVVLLGKNEASEPQALATATGIILPATSTPEAIILPTTTEAVSQTVNIVDTAIVVDKSFYTENFTSNLDTWGPPFVIGGDLSQANISLTSGGLGVQLSQNGDKKPWLYIINNAFTYTNVQLQATTTNKGNNANGVGLICQYSEKGWYDFWISNAGLYIISAVDLASNQSLELANGGSSDIQSGQAQNTFTAICQGNVLTLYINNQPVTKVTDTKFNFTEGKIGIGVASPQGLPVNVEISSLEVSAPQAQQ